MLRSLSGCGIRRPKCPKRIDEKREKGEHLWTAFYSLLKCLLGVLGYRIPQSPVLGGILGNWVFCLNMATCSPYNMIISWISRCTGVPNKVLSECIFFIVDSARMACLISMLSHVLKAWKDIWVILKMSYSLDSWKIMKHTITNLRENLRGVSSSPQLGKMRSWITFFFRLFRAESKMK